VSAIALHPSLGRPTADFAPVLPALARAGHAVHTVPPGTGATLHDLADAVVRALDAVGVEQAHLVGHAFGNRVMRCVAADHQGLDDRMAPPENGRTPVDRLGSRARLLELDRMGHAMLPERPDDLVAALCSFADDIDR